MAFMPHFSSRFENRLPDRRRRPCVLAIAPRRLRRPDWPRHATPQPAPVGMPRRLPRIRCGR